MTREPLGLEEAVVSLAARGMWFRYFPGRVCSWVVCREATGDEILFGDVLWVEVASGCTWQEARAEAMREVPL